MKNTGNAQLNIPALSFGRDHIIKRDGSRRKELFLNEAKDLRGYSRFKLTL